MLAPGRAGPGLGSSTLRDVHVQVCNSEVCIGARSAAPTNSLPAVHIAKLALGPIGDAPFMTLRSQRPDLCLAREIADEDYPG